MTISPPATVGVFDVDAALDRVAPDYDVVLRQAERDSAGDLKL